jgi:hypothetical protein
MYHTNEVHQHKSWNKNHIQQESENWLNQTSTSNCYTALLEKLEDQKHKTGPENTPKRPSYVTDVKHISPLTKLLEQIAKQQYEIKAFQAFAPLFL